MTGTFIAFEGGDASGKTTQARRVANQVQAVFTREPGGTPVSESLRSMLLDHKLGLALRTEALLMAASRAQLVHDVIRPALERGQHVISDRFLGSSLAYQAYGRGLDLDAVRGLSMFAVDGTLPDLTVLIDVPIEQSLARLGAERDRFEREDAAFHERVRRGYLALAADDPEGWAVIDGTGSLEEVAASVDAVLGERLPARLDSMES